MTFLWPVREVVTFFFSSCVSTATTMSREVIAASLVVVSEILKEAKKKRKPVRSWVKKRKLLGASNTLIKELANEDVISYNIFFRMDENAFNFLLQKTEPILKKQDTVMKEALPVKLKLEIALRFLASGDSLASLQYLYRVPKSTISNFLPGVFEAIYVARVPRTENEWMNIIQGFQEKWDFPNTIGALDGKHVVVQCPPNSTSLFFNYKGTFSVILLALVDDDYCFTAIDVGAYGSQSDSAVFSNSTLKRAMEMGTLNIPKNCFVLGDEGFPLKPYLLTPFSRRRVLCHREKVFNYRHSRARRIVENAFGIMSGRFRVFRRPICLKDTSVINLIKATCALHNWLRKTSTSYKNMYVPDEEDVVSGQIREGTWRQQHEASALVSISATRDRRYSTEAKLIREKLSEFFIGEGAVPWQDKMIH